MDRWSRAPASRPMNEGYRWTPATGAVGLGRFGTGSNSTSTASAVSGDGRIIGGAGHPVLTGAVIWDASNVPTIIGGLPGDTHGTFTAISGDGTVAAGVSVDVAGHSRGFRWTSARRSRSACHDSGVRRDNRDRHFGRRPADRRLGGPGERWSRHRRSVGRVGCVARRCRPAFRRRQGCKRGLVTHPGARDLGRRPGHRRRGIDPEGTGRGWIVTLGE